MRWLARVFGNVGTIRFEFTTAKGTVAIDCTVVKIDTLTPLNYIHC